MWATIPDVTLSEKYLPGPDVQTGDEIIAYIRANSMTAWHATSACAIGEPSNSMVVVDSEVVTFFWRNRLESY